MKIALISHRSPDDPRSFSSIPWHVLQELRRQGHEVAPLHAEPPEWARHWAQGLNLLSLKFKSQPHHIEADSVILRTRAQRLTTKIRQFQPEAVLCVGFPEVAISLPKTYPLYIWMDAFYPSLRRFYPYFKTYYSDTDARQLHRLEAKVLQRCRKIWLSSEWAANEARNDFPASAPRTGVQSFGANLTTPPSTAEVENFILLRNLAEPQLLFLANEWERKGGDAAVKTVQELRRLGCPARLAIVGLKDKPAAMSNTPWLEWVGPLDKNKPVEAQRFSQYLAESAFLIIPSTADCTPIVCHEAAAFGLPVLTTMVGGLPSTVTANQSGLLWPVEKFVSEAPAQIASLLTDRKRYETLARTSRQRFETKGNWAVNVRAVVDVITADLATLNSATI